MVSPSALLARAKKAAYANGATPVRRRALGALFARDGQGRVAHGGAKGHRQRERQTLVAALACGRGSANRAPPLASLSLAWKAVRGPRGGGERTKQRAKMNPTLKGRLSRVRCCALGASVSRPVLLLWRLGRRLGRSA